MQYVKVEIAEGRAYTYTWDGDAPLEKGERVVLPGNVVRDGEFEGVVLRLLDGPDPRYDGPYKGVLRRAEAAGRGHVPHSPDERVPGCPGCDDEDLL